VNEGLSLEGLYARYSRSVFRRARTLLADTESAKDATQEVFIRAMNARGVDFDATPMAWLYRTTTNLCLNRLRDAKRRGELLAVWPAAPPTESDADARVTVRQILEQVPEDLHEVAVYHYVDGLSHEEIASMVGVSRRTVGNRLVTFHELVGELLTKEVAP